MRSIVLLLSVSVAALVYTADAQAQIVSFGWGTDNMKEGAGYALYSDAAFIQRLVGVGVGGSFAENDYVQLIVDLDADGFAAPDFSQPKFVDPSDKLLAEAFIGLNQNTPPPPYEQTGQFWAGGMSQYGAQYNSDAPCVGKPIMVRFWDAPRDQILALHNDPVEEPSWGEYSGGMTLPATSTDWAFMETAGTDLYTDQQAPPAGPALSVSPTSLYFSAVEGGENPANQTLQVWNSGQGTLDWLITEEIDWLTASPDSGSSSGEKDDVEVSVSIVSLPAATYNGSITVSAEGAQGSPRTVELTLEITSAPTPELSCSPDSFSFSAIEGGDNPADETLQVWNSGESSLDWSIEEDIPWLFVSPGSGSSSGEKDDVAVSVDISTLSAGDYGGEMSVSAPGADGSPKTISVSLQITPPGQPELAVDPTMLTFWGVEGGSNPPDQSVEVWNTGGGSLNWSIQEDIPWLSTSPITGSSIGEKDDVDVSVDIIGLPTGTYNGQMTVSAPEALGSPASIEVTLQIFPRGQLVYFGWGTDDTIGGDGYALYSDADLTQRLEGTGVAGSFEANDYVQLIVDMDQDGFASPDFSRPDLVDASDMLLAEAFIGLMQNSPSVNASEQTGQFWAGGMTQYGAQYNSDDAWVGKPIIVRFWDMPKGQIRAAYQDPLLEPHWGQYGEGMLLPAITTDWSFTDAAGSDLYTDQAPPGPPPIGEPVYFGWGTDKVVGGEGYALYSDAALTQRLEGIGISGSFGTNDYVQLIVDLDEDGFAGPDFTRPGFINPSDKLLAEAFVGLGQNSPAVNPGEHTGQFWGGGFTQFGAQYNSVDPWVGKPIMARFWSAPKDHILALYQAEDPGLLWGEYSGGMTLPDTNTDWSFTDDAQSDLYTFMGINQSPALSDIGNKEVDENQLLTFVVSATDPDGTTPTLVASNLPPGATFVDNGDGTGTFDWTPTYEQAGSYPNVHFEASDGVFTDSEDITITVNNVNRAPILLDIGEKEVDESQLLTFVVSATDPDGTTPSLVASNLPAGATFVDNGDGTGTFEWIPTADQVGVHPDVHFEASDGELSDSEGITITVSAAGKHAPILTSIGNKLVYEGTELRFVITATDPDGTTPTLVAANLPPGATFVDNGDGTGTFTWTPTYQQAGTYGDIVFEASDGELTDMEVIYVQVIDVVRAAVIVEITATPDGIVCLRWEGEGLFTVQHCQGLASWLWEDMPGTSWPITDCVWEGDLSDVRQCFLRVVAE